jgi:succinyl-CoA synthetase beta subunit
MVKAQIHAGGRCEGTVREHPQQFGVQRVNAANEAAEAARNLLGCRLMTSQTGPEGQVVRRVLVEQRHETCCEFYVGIVIDRVARCPVVLASTHGGTEIERVAARSPELVHREAFHPDKGLGETQARKLVRRLGLAAPSAGTAETVVRQLCRVFVERDCSLLEVNPLAMTPHGTFLVLDVKMSFDDNALFRHDDLLGLRDCADVDSAGNGTADTAVNYLRLDGNIGCLVNGAGLAMSTMDLLQFFGGRPANFLDVGGSATQYQIEEALRTLLADRQIQTVLVNVFGGITRCSTIAQAIKEVLCSRHTDVPVVVRFEGTEAEEGRRLLVESNLDVVISDGLADAARKAVATAKLKAA